MQNVETASDLSAPDTMTSYVVVINPGQDRYTPITSESGGLIAVKHRMPQELRMLKDNEQYIKSKMNTIQSRIDSFQGSQEQLGQLQLQLDTSRSDLDGIQNRIDSIQPRFNTLELERPMSRTGQRVIRARENRESRI